MKRVSCCLFVLLYLFPADDAVAASSFEGTKAGVSKTALGLYGGQVEDILVASNGTVYAALLSPNGVFCSTDQAETWSGPPETADFGNTVKLALGESPSTVYFIAGIKLFKLTDTCGNWAQLAPDSEEIKDFGWAAAYGHGVLLAGMRSGRLARSEDQGATFSAVTIHTAVTNIIVIAASPAADTFFAIAEKDGTKELFLSTDSGATWATTGKTGAFSALAVNPENGQELVLVSSSAAELSTNGGESWSDLNFPAAIPRPTANYVNGRIYVTGYWTDNSGASWHDMQASAGHVDSPLGWYIAGDPSDAQLLYSASDRGVAKTVDGGTNWYDKVQGMLGVRIRDIAQSTDKGTVYMAAQGGLAKCANFTDTENRDWVYPLQITGAYISPQAVVIDPQNPDIVIAAAGPSIYYSADGGGTWNTATSPISSGNGSVSDFAFLDDGTYVAAFYRDNFTGGVLRSTDNGHTWSSMTVPGDPPLNVILPVEDKLFAGAGRDFDPNTTTNRGIYYYDGSSWSQLSGIMDGLLVADMTYTGTTLFAVAGDGNRSAILRSGDSGETWEELTSYLLPPSSWYRSVAHDPANPTTLYVASGRPAGQCKIYYSSDNGDNWNVFYTGLIDEVPEVMMVDALTAGFNTGAYEIEQALSSPVYAMWNGFLGMTNVLEIVNRGATPVTATVTVYTISGTAGQPITFTLAAQGERDLILNDAGGFSPDSYGLVRIDYAGGILDGRVSFYRSSSSPVKGAYDFAFAVPLENSLTGASYVGFNTFQPSQNPAEAANQVANWLSIINLHGESKTFTVNRYNQAGVLTTTRSITVPPFGRSDIEGGHGEGPSLVGLNEIIPGDSSAPYKAELVRYGSDGSAGVIPSSYSFAFPLLARAGGAREQWMPISSGAGAVNWVEVANAANEPLTAEITLFDNYGNEVMAAHSFPLAAHAQQHFNAGALLPAGASGAARIRSEREGAIAAQSMFYFYGAAGSVQAMYGSQAASPANGQLAGSWNLFLGMNNWLRIFNTTAEAVEVTLTVYNNGLSRTSTFPLAGHSGTDLGLHETSTYGTSTDMYGMVDVEGSGLSAELLRIKPMIGGVDFAMPTKVRP